MAILAILLASADAQDEVPATGSQVEVEEGDLEKGRSLVSERKFTDALPLLRKAASAGSLEAQELCAFALIEIGSPSDYSEVQELLQKAVEKGSVLALEEQGRLALFGGLGQKSDFVRAQELLMEAITRPGARNSFYYLGKMAAEGLGRERDASLAVSFLRRGESAESVLSMVALGQLFLGEGELVDQDLPQAEGLFRKAYQLGSGDAAFYLGMIEENLREDSPSWERALSWFKKGAKLRHARSYVKLGDYFLQNRGGKIEDAFRCYQAAAELGNARAAFTLGMMYAQGRTVPKDLVASSAWLRIAADRGDYRAQNQLGIRLLSGLGVPLNLEEATRFFEQAAQQGYPAAKYNLATILINHSDGKGNAGKNERALKFLQDAAEDENPDAAALLAKFFSRGELLSADPVQAAYWAAKAVEFAKGERFQDLAQRFNGQLNQTQQERLAEMLSKP